VCNVSVVFWDTMYIHVYRYIDWRSFVQNVNTITDRWPKNFLSEPCWIFFSLRNKSRDSFIYSILKKSSMAHIRKTGTTTPCSRLLWIPHIVSTAHRLRCKLVLSIHKSSALKERDSVVDVQEQEIKQCKHKKTFTPKCIHHKRKNSKITLTTQMA